MRVLVEYRDGSKKVQLDDGREVIISAPYMDGSRKIDGDDGSSGWLSDEYNDGSKRATMNDGTIYSVDERNTYFSGKQETWGKVSSGGGSDLGLMWLVGFIFAIQILAGIIMISPLIIPFIIGGWMIKKKIRSDKWNKALVISCFVTPIIFVLAYNFIDSFPIELIPVSLVLYFLMGGIGWVFLINKFDITRIKFW